MVHEGVDRWANPRTVLIRHIHVTCTIYPLLSDPSPMSRVGNTASLKFAWWHWIWVAPRAYILLASDQR